MSIKAIICVVVGFGYTGGVVYAVRNHIITSIEKRIYLWPQNSPQPDAKAGSITCEVSYNVQSNQIKQATYYICDSVKVEENGNTDESEQKYTHFSKDTNFKPKPNTDYSHTKWNRNENQRQSFYFSKSKNNKNPDMFFIVDTHLFHTSHLKMKKMIMEIEGFRKEFTNKVN